MGSFCIISVGDSGSVFLIVSYDLTIRYPSGITLVDMGEVSTLIGTCIVGTYV